jgi:flavin-dependent dehydrogenase
MDTEYDIAIVGGGPAGASLASLIGSRWKVALIDDKPLDVDRRNPAGGKCCGGLLAPDAQRALASLALALPSELLESPQLFTVRAIDRDNGLERHYQRHYLNVNRFAFDDWLLSLAARSADVLRGTRCRSVERDRAGGFTLALSSRGGTREIRASIVVGADGALSIVRRRMGLRPERRYFAIQEYFRADRPIPSFVSYFDREVTDFYSWVIPKRDWVIVGGAFDEHARPAERMGLLRRRLAAYGFAFADGAPIARDGCFVIRPRLRDAVTGSKGMYLIGEAAGFISPSSAEGVSWAIRSAVAFARAAERSLDGVGARYAAHAASLKRGIAVKNLKSPFMYSRALRSLALRSGVKSVYLERSFSAPPEEPRA